MPDTSLAVERDDDVAFAQLALRRGAVGLDRRDEDAARHREAVEPDDLPRDRRVLPGHADVRAPDPAVANQPADDELRGVRGNGETQPLRAGDDGRVHADHLAARVDERSAGVSRD